MPKAPVNGIEIAYETSGDPDGPPILLIAGLGMQLIDWPDHFLDPLAVDHRLIRYDNRDSGLSTQLHGEPHDVVALMAAIGEGEEPALAYGLDAMAADAIGVLDHLGIASAHVVGISLGGMIAQEVAIRFAERVSSLTLMMTASGNPDFGQPTAEALEAILAAPPAGDRDTRIDHGVRIGRIWGSPEHFDEATLRETLAASWDRAGAQPEGRGRQACAVAASSPRDDALRSVDVPTLVVHGSADTLITPSGAEQLAACIPGAELAMIEGMGHDLPKALIDQVIAPIRRLVASHPATPA